MATKQLNVSLEHYNDLVVHAINEDRISGHILETFSVTGASYLQRIRELLEPYRIYRGFSIDKKLTLGRKEKREAENPFAELYNQHINSVAKLSEFLEAMLFDIAGILAEDSLEPSTNLIKDTKDEFDLQLEVELHYLNLISIRNMANFQSQQRVNEDSKDFNPLFTLLEDKSKIKIVPTIRLCSCILFQTQNYFLTKYLGNSGGTILVKEGDTVPFNRVENFVDIEDEVPKNVEVLMEHNKILEKYCGSIIVWDEKLSTTLKNSDKSEISKKNHKLIIIKYLIMRFGISLYFKFFAYFIIHKYETDFSQNSGKGATSVTTKIELPLKIHDHLYDFVKKSVKLLNKRLETLYGDSRVRNGITYKDNVKQSVTDFTYYLENNFKVLRALKIRERFDMRDVISYLGYEASGELRKQRESSYDEVILNRYKLFSDYIGNVEVDEPIVNMITLQTAIFLRRNPISHLRYSYMPDEMMGLEFIKITPTSSDGGTKFYQKTVGKSTDFRVYFLNGYMDRVAFMLYHIITHSTFFFALLDFTIPEEKNIRYQTIQLIPQGNLFQEYKTLRISDTTGLMTKRTRKKVYLSLHTILRKELNMKKPYSPFSVLNVLSKIVIDSEKLLPDDVFLKIGKENRTELSNAYKNLCLDFATDLFCKSFFALHPYPIMRLNFPYNDREESENKFVRFDKIYAHGNFAVHFSALNLRDIYGFLQKPMFFKKHSNDELDEKLKGEATYYILDKKTGSFIKKKIVLESAKYEGHYSLPIDSEELLPYLSSAGEFFRNPKLVTQFNHEGNMIWKFEYKFGTKQLGMIKVMVDDILYNNLISTTINYEKDSVSSKKRGIANITKKNVFAVNLDNDYSRILFSPLQRKQDTAAKLKSNFKENEPIDLTSFNEQLETIPENEPQKNPFVYKNESENEEDFRKQNGDLKERLLELEKMWIVFHTIYKFNSGSATNEVSPDLLLMSQDDFKKNLIEKLKQRSMKEPKSDKDFYIFDSERDIKKKSSIKRNTVENDPKIKKDYLSFFRDGKPTNGYKVVTYIITQLNSCNLYPKVFNVKTEPDLPGNRIPDVLFSVYRQQLTDKEKKDLGENPRQNYINNYVVINTSLESYSTSEVGKGLEESKKKLKKDILQRFGIDEEASKSAEKKVIAEQYSSGIDEDFHPDLGNNKSLTVSFKSETNKEDTLPHHVREVKEMAEKDKDIFFVCLSSTNNIAEINLPKVLDIEDTKNYVEQMKNFIKKKTSENPDSVPISMLPLLVEKGAKLDIHKMVQAKSYSERNRDTEKNVFTTFIEEFNTKIEELS